MEPLPGGIQYYEIIHVADVELAAEHFLDIVIEPVEVDIREELAREVPDRYAPTSLQGREKIVTVEMECTGLVRAGADDLPDEPCKRRYGR